MATNIPNFYNMKEAKQFFKYLWRYSSWKCWPPVVRPKIKYCWVISEPFFSRTRKLPCIFAALFVCYSSRLRLRDSLLRPCYDFLLFFTTQTRPVHRETDSGDEKFITPINKIHNPILGYALDPLGTLKYWDLFPNDPSLDSLLCSIGGLRAF